jgi:glyoxylate/hydroxypyruvate reductase A
MSFVYKADPARGAEWARHFAERVPELPFHIWPETGDPAAVRFLATWRPPDDIGSLFPNLEVLFSTGAGVDQFEATPLPPGVALVRMVEPGIIESMV